MTKALIIDDGNGKTPIAAGGTGASTAADARTNLGLGTIATKNYAALDVAVNEAQGSDIASATTTDIGAATGNYVNVTGTTTITGLGTVQAGTRRIVNFTGALTLTHNATSLILPTAANITTAAGDTAVFVSLGSGNWKCVSYDRASGAALASSGGGASNFVSVYLSSDQSVTSASSTKVLLNTEVFDTGSNFDNATNYRYTAPSTGYYHLNAATYLTSIGGASTPYALQIKVNGTIVAVDNALSDGFGAAIAHLNVDTVLSLTASDYVEMFVQSTDTNYAVAAANDSGTASQDKTTRMSIYKLA